MNNLINRTNGKIDVLQKDLNKKTERYLTAISKRERQLRKKILRFDSTTAITIFSYDPMKQMELYMNKIKLSNELVSASNHTGQYYPYVDSLQCLLGFMALNNGSIPEEINASVKKIKLLESKFSVADNLKQTLQQRKEQIKNYLLRKGNVPSSIKKMYNDYAKQSFYYLQEVNELKESFNNPDKALKTALTIANKSAAFKSFVQQNSFLSQFFNTQQSIGAGNTQAVIGLVSRGQLLETINSFTGRGQSLEAMIQQTVGKQQGQLTTNLPGQIGGKDETIEIPNYEPNQERTKKFGKRIEYGTNFQTQRGTTYFPVTTDLAMTVGYKLNNKSIMGVGASYKMGLGSNISNIRITSEGIGLRSFLDYKIKGSFFVSGGVEYNYQQPSVGLLPVNLTNGWTTSGLIGVTKTIKMNTKFFKTSKVQVLWDFLGKGQIPQRQQFIFRVGYNL